jgi:hypothetical protein
MAVATTPVRKWYVLRTFSGHEKKVKEFLESEVERLGMEDKLTQVLIPTETVFEMRGGKSARVRRASSPATCSSRRLSTRTSRRSSPARPRRWASSEWATSPRRCGPMR